MTAPVLAHNTDNGRFYSHPQKAKDVPSITNITGMKNKPGLPGYYARQCSEYAADNIETLAKLDRAARVDLIRGAPWRKTDVASGNGDLVHYWIEQHIKSGGELPTPDDIAAPYIVVDDKRFTNSHTTRGMWRQFVGLEDHYRDKYGLRWLMSEVTVWSDTYDYAGTLDWIAEIKGQVVLGDTKTGKNVYPEVGMQVAAAANADYGFDEQGEPFELPHFDRFACLHVRPRGARLIPLKVDGAFESFLGLRACHKWECEAADRVVGYAPKIETRA